MAQQRGGAAVQRKTVTNPAAGAEVIFTVPASTRWELFAVQFTLVSSATAGNRFPELIIDDGANELFRTVAVNNQAASLTRLFQFLSGFPALSGQPISGSTSIVAPLPLDMPTLPAGFRIRTATGNIKVDDQYSGAIASVYEYPSP